MFLHDPVAGTGTWMDLGFRSHMVGLTAVSSPRHYYLLKMKSLFPEWHGSL